MRDKIFYQYVHYFRGICILLIVAAHCWSMPIYMFNDNQLPEHLTPLFSGIEALFHGSTIYFAMISGILFSLVLKDKPYKAFMKTKALNVYVPFILISVMYIGIWAAMGMVNPPPDLAMWQLVAGMTFFTVTGHASGHLWYIPVIMILFAMTPWLNRAVDSPRKFWFILFLMLPLVISRVWPNFHPATVIYFIGPYMLGLYIGKNMDSIIRWIEQRNTLLIATFLLFSGVYYFMLLNDIGPVQWGFMEVNGQETVTYILRMAFAMVMLNLFHKTVHSVPPVIDYLARYSFSIYFIHVAFIMLFMEIAKAYSLVPQTLAATFVYGLGTLIMSVTLSVLVSIGIQKLMGQRSRLLIGA